MSYLKLLGVFRWLSPRVQQPYPVTLTIFLAWLCDYITGVVAGAVLVLLFVTHLIACAWHWVGEDTSQ